MSWTVMVCVAEALFPASSVAVNEYDHVVARGIAGSGLAETSIVTSPQLSAAARRPSASRPSTQPCSRQGR